ncbi:MAG: NADH-quinone oxidoreductase subunit NuoG [Lysobacterales bacterium]
MSAQPTAAASDLLNIEIDGQKLQAPKGAMIIQVADKAGIQIPRFCYHDKLAIAANCRMCLVDVEKAPKPMPACATPIMEGMKVYTRSKRALDSQRNVMEFLLVNHPLDCPICDQGGECELQDVAMGYGRSVSRFAERKRVVPDEDLGPLVATEMTRCIHCTRCVRFMDDIAGTTELGGMFRGEHTEIGTYIGRSLQSEISANIIDLCPVGALTNKVFRFRARPWELIARESIGCHDALGSNLYLHMRRGEVLRTVPRDNEAVNENWLSDRDRFSHQSLTHSDRAQQPMLKRAGQWVPVSWEEAIEQVAGELRGVVSRHGADQLASLVSPNVSAEEMLLLQALTRGLGSSNVDHRLQQLDFRDDAARATAPVFGAPLADYVHARSILLVGAHPRHEAPLLGHRIRRAWKLGAEIHAVNPLGFDHHYSLSNDLVCTPDQMVAELAAVLCAALNRQGQPVPAWVSALAAAASERTTAIAASLLARTPARILYGHQAAAHAQASALRALAQLLAQCTQASYDELPAGANAVAAWQTGCVPHRRPDSAAASAGAHLGQLLATPRKAYVLYGAEVPEDFADPRAAQAALAQAECVIAFTAFASDAVRAHAHIILPIGLPAEIDGTYVNVDQCVQRANAAAKLPGEARPGWRVLRALGERLSVAGFDFVELQELRARLDPLLSTKPAAAADTQAYGLERADGAGLIVQRYVPIYAVDAMVRRSPALQGTVLSEGAELAVHPEDAQALNIVDTVQIGDQRYACRSDARVPRGVCRVPGGMAATAALPANGQRVQVVAVRHG